MTVKCDLLKFEEGIFSGGIFCGGQKRYLICSHPVGGGEFSANQKKHLFMQNLWQGDFFAETPSTGGIPKINYFPVPPKKIPPPTGGGIYPLLKIFFPNFRLYSLTLKVY